MSYSNNHNISALIGRTIAAVADLELNSDCATISCTDGTAWRMLHIQDCCESVSIADIVGDVADLIGLVIDAREESNTEAWPDNVTEPEYRDDSFTWTFYIIQTDKGAVTIRWLGQSNGYYSEAVDFELVSGTA